MAGTRIPCRLTIRLDFGDHNLLDLGGNPKRTNPYRLKFMSGNQVRCLLKERVNKMATQVVGLPLKAHFSGHLTAP